MVTITRSNTSVTNPDYPPERTLPGAMARLLSEDWGSMTAKANASPNHVSSPERWFRKAKEANPTLTDEQAARLGEMMRREHYQRIGKLSAKARKKEREARQARKLARELQAEMDTADEVA